MAVCCAQKKSDEIDLSKVDLVIGRYGSDYGSLIPVLQKTQEELGFLPIEVLERIAKGLRVPASSVFGVATFYSQFRLKPVGKYIIKVCHGTACHVAGGTKITEAFERQLKVKDGETSEDRLFTLESVACLGCCSLAPVAMIEKETYGRLSGDRVTKVVSEYHSREKQGSD